MAYTLNDVREAVKNRNEAVQAELDRIRKDKEEFIMGRITSITDAAHEILMCKGGLGEVYNVDELDEGTVFTDMIETARAELDLDEAYATSPINIDGSPDFSAFLSKHLKEINEQFGKVDGWATFALIPTNVKYRPTEQDKALTEIWNKNVMAFPFDYDTFNRGRPPTNFACLTVRLVAFAKKAPVHELETIPA